MPVAEMLELCRGLSGKVYALLFRPKSRLPNRNDLLILGKEKKNHVYTWRQISDQ